MKPAESVLAGPRTAPTSDAAKSETALKSDRSAHRRGGALSPDAEFEVLLGDQSSAAATTSHAAADILAGPASVPPGTVAAEPEAGTPAAAVPCTAPTASEAMAKAPAGPALALPPATAAARPAPFSEGQAEEESVESDGVAIPDDAEAVGRPRAPSKEAAMETVLAEPRPPLQPAVDQDPVTLGGTETTRGAEVESAGKSARAEPSRQLPTPPAVAQVAVAIERANEHRFEIRLDPPELGRVRIHLTPSENGLQAMVISDRPETHDLLRRHAETLARDLAAAGWESVTLDFSSSGDASANHGDAGPSIVLFDAPETAPLSPSAVSQPSLRGTLDIRL